MSDQAERVEAVRARLQANPKLAAAVKRQVDQGLLERMGAPRTATGGNGTEQLESLTTAAALEAIVQRVGRPPLLIQDNAVVIGPDDSLDDFPAEIDSLIRGSEKHIPSVGRVVFLNFRMDWGGTGWVIASDGKDRIVATNRHVAGLVARRTVDGHGVFLRDPMTQIRYQARLDFREELGSIGAEAIHFDVAEVRYISETWQPDVALLRITGDGLPSPLPLADQAAAVADLVAIIGFPAFDDRNDLSDMARYFRDLYDVKRFAPGRVTQAQGPGVVLSHDCTSLGGNSGSPVIRLSDGAVVGLHFAGEYGVANSAVGVGTLKAIVDGAQPAAVSINGARTEAAADGVHQPNELANRQGYDPNFLGGGALAAHWPGLAEAVTSELTTPNDEVPSQPFEIRYTNFGVRFSRLRRQPLMTAVNIDGAHWIEIKRGNDKWFRDARIPLEAQLRKADYADEDIDRGHLVRRQDPNWDPSVPVGNPRGVVTPRARQANDDTFHYTNAALQHGDFNSGMRQWLGLEDYILTSAETHDFRACVFTGPIWNDEDTPLPNGLLAPREFWKLVVMEDADRGKLHATAYLLSQGQLIRDLIEKRSRIEGVEGFVLGPYRTFQIAIADLAEATGFDFSAYTEADPLAATAGGQEAMRSGEPLVIPLDSLDRIVL